MDKYNFYKERYYREIERIATIESGFTLPVGVLSFIASLIAIEAQSFNISDWNEYPVLLVMEGALVLMGFFYTSRALIYLYNAYHYAREGIEGYMFLPYAPQIEAYDFNQRNYLIASNRSESVIDASLETQLIEWMVEYTGVNENINDVRRENLHAVKRPMIFGLAVVLLASVPAGIKHFQSVKPSVQVEVTKFPAKINSIQDTNGPTTSDTATATKTATENYQGVSETRSSSKMKKGAKR